METVDNIQRFVIEELKESYPDGICDTDCKLPVALTKINQKYGVKNYDNGVEFWFELEQK